MTEYILTVGYSHHEVRKLKLHTHDTGIIYEQAHSPEELEQLIEVKQYSFIFCKNDILDYVPYITTIRNVKDIPIIIGSVEHCEASNVLARLTSVIKDDGCIKAGSVFINIAHRTASVDGHEINLTVTEYNLLSLLVANPMRVFTYEMIMDIIWQEDCSCYSRKAIHNHISKLKQKMKAVSNADAHIKSIPGVGYKYDIK